MAERRIVGVIRETIAAYNRGDFDRIASGADEDFEFRPARQSPSQVIRGRGELRRFFEPEALESVRVEISEIRDLGEKVLVVGENHGRGTASGVDISQPVWLLYTVADDRLKGMEIFFDEPAALRAAGLEAG